MKYPAMIILITSIFSIVGCGPKVGSDDWCKEMKEKPGKEWTLEETGDYPKHCLLNQKPVGSDKWCDEMQDKPKKEWTLEETGDYTKHCLLNQK